MQTGCPEHLSLAIADINRDGRDDIVVTNSCDVTPTGGGCSSSSSPNQISILLGNGDGTFQSPVSYGAGAAPFQLAVGDLNADGWPDIVETDYQGTTVSALLNKGDGTFLAPVSYNVDQKVASNLTVTVTTSPQSTAMLGPSGRVTLNWLLAAIFLVVATLPQTKPRRLSFVGLVLFLVLCGCGDGSTAQLAKTAPTKTEIASSKHRSAGLCGPK